MAKKQDKRRDHNATEAVREASMPCYCVLYQVKFLTAEGRADAAKNRN